MRLRSVVAALLISALASPVFAQGASATVVKPGKQIDSVWNGVLIGAGAGAVATWIFTRANCGPTGHDVECTAVAALGGAAVFIPSGALIGGIVDRLINKTLPPAASAHTSIAPILSKRDGRRNAGIALNLKIRF